MSTIGRKRQKSRVYHLVANDGVFNQLLAKSLALVAVLDALFNAHTRKAVGLDNATHTLQ